MQRSTDDPPACMQLFRTWRPAEPRACSRLVKKSLNSGASSTFHPNSTAMAEVIRVGNGNRWVLEASVPRLANFLAVTCTVIFPVLFGKNLATAFWHSSAHPLSMLVVVQVGFQGRLTWCTASVPLFPCCTFRPQGIGRHFGLKAQYLAAVVHNACFRGFWV